MVGPEMIKSTDFNGTYFAAPSSLRQKRGRRDRMHLCSAWQHDQPRTMTITLQDINVITRTFPIALTVSTSFKCNLKLLINYFSSFKSLKIGIHNDNSAE
ncbi:unnamed protein product [Dovyalis caffra]|uniref:Uncharacterized protein n=1 Tax=Dovyalis caffra TaxID=77055 RepID=A0AAV1SW33_9ROSI|nr:unnamed protein product [Dovyalis caffra]